VDVIVTRFSSEPRTTRQRRQNRLNGVSPHRSYASVDPIVLLSVPDYSNGATAKGGTATPFRRTTIERDGGMKENSLPMG
jgi:hypothetical protein